MTVDRRRKREIRERMKQTGEKYLQAARAIEQERQEQKEQSNGDQSGDHR